MKNKVYTVQRSMYGTWLVMSHCQTNGAEREFETMNKIKAEGVKEYLTSKMRTEELVKELKL